MLLAPALGAQTPQAGKITTPKEFFGFNIGDDWHLANYDQFQEYWKKIDAESDRMVVQEIGKTAEGRPQLIIPYSLAANDMRFTTPPGFDNGEEFFQFLKDSFDALYEEGRQGSPKMMSVGLHCRLDCHRFDRAEKLSGNRSIDAKTAEREAPG